MAISSKLWSCESPELPSEISGRRFSPSKLSFLKNGEDSTTIKQEERSNFKIQKRINQTQSKP